MSELLPWPSGGRRNLRVLLLVIILATAPLYCLGFLLWGVAPGSRPPATLTPTLTPLFGTATATPTYTPFRRVLVTVTRPLPPTPRQFQPPVQRPQPQPVQPVQPVVQPPPDLSLPVVPAPVQQPVGQPTPTPGASPTVVPVQGSGS